MKLGDRARSLCHPKLWLQLLSLTPIVRLVSLVLMLRAGSTSVEPTAFLAVVVSASSPAFVEVDKLAGLQALTLLRSSIHHRSFPFTAKGQQAQSL